MSTNTKLAEALRRIVNTFPIPVEGVEQADRASLRIALFTARAALAAHDAEQAAKAVPAGFKLVPVEPTPEMLKAADLEHASRGLVSIALISYRAMLAAAPQPAERVPIWLSDAEIERLAAVDFPSKQWPACVRLLRAAGCVEPPNVGIDRPALAGPVE